MIAFAVRRLVATALVMFALSVTGPIGMPLVSATVEIEIAARKTGKAQMMSRMRERIWSTMPPKKPAMRAMIVAMRQQSAAETRPMIRELRPP